MPEFSVKSIKNQWKPPFKKDVTEQAHSVGEGQGFESIGNNGEYIFRLLKAEEDKALIEFNYAFTLKGHVHPGNRQIWIMRGKPESFTYLWGEDGITKKIELK